MFKKHLKVHYNAINSVCSEIDQDFIYRFKALYYEVHAHSSTHDDSINQALNLELKEFGDQIKSLFPIFRFYMNKAFPYDSNLWEAYGYCEIETVIHDYSSLSKCLDGSVKLIKEKRSALRLAKCPDPILDEIVRLSKLVGDANNAMIENLENVEIKNKINKARLNELFKLMKIVHNAASKCFKNDPELLMYLTFPFNEQLHS
jgi:hypothetical protein